jgi:peroxiredoxin
MKSLKIITVIAFLGLLTVGYITATSLSKEDLSQSNAHNLTENKNTKKGYDIGDVALDFRLKNIDGKMISMADFPDAKGYILIFTCNHCPYSVAYEDRIIAIHNEYAPKGFPVIAINPNNPEYYKDDSFEQMQIRARDKGFTFPYLIDAGQRVYPRFGATKTPHVFLIQNENDQHIVKYIGAIDDNHKDEKAVRNHYLKDALEALLNGEKIKETKTVAIGCSIK